MKRTRDNADRMEPSIVRFSVLSARLCPRCPSGVGADGSPSLVPRKSRVLRHDAFRFVEIRALFFSMLLPLRDQAYDQRSDLARVQAPPRDFRPV